MTWPPAVLVYCTHLHQAVVDKQERLTGTQLLHFWRQVAWHTCQADRQMSNGGRCRRALLIKRHARSEAVDCKPCERLVELLTFHRLQPLLGWAPNSADSGLGLTASDS